MRPPLSSSQSPLSSVSACGENCARSLAPPLPTARGAAGAPHRDIKKKMRRARWKRKNVRRVGLRRRRPPAAGGGRLAVPCGNQGRKRAALGETSSPGNSGIPAAPLFAAAGRLLMRVSTWANATTLTPARAARSEAERAERGANQMRPCTPTTSVPSATGRQYRLRRRPKRARRQGQIGACTDPSTPVARRAAAPERANAFLFGPCTARFSFGKTKEKWGVHPRWTSPPAGADPLPAAVRRPLPPSSGCICPAIPMTVFPRRQTAAPFHRKGRITPHAGHHPTTGI